MRYPNLNLDVAHFLAKVWQNKPLLIKQGLPNFTDPIDENDLAGLALEPDIDSRIVSLHEQTWSVTQGPFEDFNKHCKGKWTLMVQGVDRWVDDISDLSRLFDFIPNWRFDDVMISYSVPGAGVGPHVDQYDVFLIQGKGQRRWQVGSPEEVSEASPLPSLQQVRPFEPLIDEVLNPGDILYIPPGWPHYGTTVENCMTYSIGFRAPNTKDLLQPFNDSVLNEQNSQRFTDPSCIDLNERGRTPSHHVSDLALNKLTDLLKGALHSKAWKYALLEYISDQQLPLEAPECEFTQQDIIHLLLSDTRFTFVSGCRPLTNNTFPNTIFINGVGYDTSARIKEHVMMLVSSNNPTALPHHFAQSEAVDLLIEWLNEGIMILK